MSDRRIPENTSGYARWLADQIARRSGGIRLSATTSLFVAMALEGYADWLDRTEAKGLPFNVTAIEPAATGESEVVAAALNLHVATAAFTAAAMTRPGARLMLRDGTRVVSVSDRRPPPAADESGDE
jgi:hypothetical protein